MFRNDTSNWLIAPGDDHLVSCHYQLKTPATTVRGILNIAAVAAVDAQGNE